MGELVRAGVKQILIHGQGAADDSGIDGFHPVDPSHFGANAQVFIGEVGDDLSDSFDVVVCTPSWAATALTKDWDTWWTGLTVLPRSVLPGAAFWFMRQWNADEFKRAADALCDAHSPAPDWGSVASRIGRSLPWEFDYKYDAHVDQNYGQPFPPKK